MSRLTNTPEWQALAALVSMPRQPNPLQGLIHAAGIDADFSRQHLDVDVCRALEKLAMAMEIETRREELFTGIHLNHTEDRPVLHTALRAPPNQPLLAAGTDIMPTIRLQLKRVRAFSAAVRNGTLRGATGQLFTDIVNIGIGGSSLGPEMAYQALRRYASGPRVHFVSNVDGAHLADVLGALNPATTLFVIASKTFTTDETLTNARSAQRWLGELPDAAALHFVAVTANPGEAQRQGYKPERIFEFRDWVGGRFSLWSAIGLPIALGLGFEAFRHLLDGAQAMDEHFRHAPLAQNLPVLLALTGIWNRNFLGIGSLAILPYAQRLKTLPSYLQQLEMESNGKRVDREGNVVDYATCPVIFGDAGTNSQHSFHQLLHQGTDSVAVDFIVPAAPESNHAEHHSKLLANVLAQADALWQGKTFATAYAELQNKIVDDAQRRLLATHKVYPGGRPSTLLILPRLDPVHLGALIALYEHKVFVQGVIWNVNSFDQWGVELGKEIAKSLLPVVSGSTPPPQHLQAVVEKLRQV